MVEQHPPIRHGTLDRLRTAQADIRDEYLAANSDPWIIGYSGGKDSTLLAQLVFEMLLDLAPSDRKRPVHLLCNDTLVESPVLTSYIDKMLARLQTAAENLHLPIVVVKTTPDPDQTFWVNLIGRGYPAPTRMFRWCTDRMKIAPTSNYIRTKISESGEVVLLLGVRSAESANRAVTTNRHRNIAGSRLNAHDDMKGVYGLPPHHRHDHRGRVADLASTNAALGRKPPGVGDVVSQRTRRRMPAGHRQVSGSVVRQVVLSLRLLDMHCCGEGSEHGSDDRFGT
jgi:hypothetical protein